MTDPQYRYLTERQQAMLAEIIRLWDRPPYHGAMPVWWSDAADQRVLHSLVDRGLVTKASAGYRLATGRCGLCGRELP